MTDAVALYRLLWLRGLAISLPVSVVVGIGGALAADSEDGGATVAAQMLGLVGAVFVQAFLVEAVRNAHEGKPQETIGTLYERAGTLFLPLLMSALVYAVGGALGLLLFIIPGLILLSRWALFVPLMVIDGLNGTQARRRSNELVKGKTVTVLLSILVVVLAAMPGVIALEIAGRASAVSGIVIGIIWSALLGPFQAHVLTSIYYRLTDGTRPVVHPSLRR